MENNNGKYLKYAIGEITLVVIGILIAFSINNWNESRKRDIAEIEFIEGIKSDLKEDKIYIELVIDQLKPKINVFNLLNKELSELYEKDKNKLDSIFQIYFVSQRTFYPISGSFQAAISGNEINTYKNKEVTRAIIKLYNSTYDRLIDNGEMLDGRWDYISQKFAYERRTGRFSEMNIEESFELLDDMYYHVAQVEWYQKMLIESIKEIDKLLEKN